MARPHLVDVAAMTPADLAIQREAEAKSLALGECHAVRDDTAALLARCDQLLRLNAVPPGYAAIVRELAHAIRLRAPTMFGILPVRNAD